VEEIKKENQNIVNNVANTTIVRREKTSAEKLSSLDDTILAKIKQVLGDFYYPMIYIFWSFIIFIAILVIFKFAFLFSSPSEQSNNGSEGGTSVPLLGIVIMSLIVIFAVYYYFSYTYNVNSSYTVI
jgi:heme/copper-type cytochrome/quinol oxidase subunit 2